MHADIRKSVFSEDEFHIIKPDYIYGSGYQRKTRVYHNCPKLKSFYHKIVNAIKLDNPGGTYEPVVPFDMVTIDFAKCGECGKSAPESVKTLLKMEASFDTPVNNEGDFYAQYYNTRKKERDNLIGKL